MLSRTAVLVAAAVVTAFPSLSSQTDSTASIQGVARSSFNGAPLVGVMIAVPAARKFAVTDSSGRFALVGLPAGAQRVRVAYEGRTTEEYVFQLKRGKTKQLAVVLDIEAFDLAPVVVEAQHRDFSRNLAGFYERRTWYAGFGRFYTREDLERRHPSALSQLLTAEGIFTRCLARGCIPVRWSRGSMCAVAVSVDGMPFWEDSYDQVPVDDVQGVEIYRSDFHTPPAWGGLIAASPPGGGGNLYEPRGTCSSVQIWTR